MVVAAMAAGVVVILLVAAVLHKRNSKPVDAAAVSAAADFAAQDGASSEGEVAAGGAHTQILEAASLQQCKRGTLEAVVDLQCSGFSSIDKIIRNKKKTIYQRENFRERGSWILEKESYVVNIEAHFMDEF